MKKYKERFIDVRYKTLDFSEKYKPTIIDDVHSVPLKDNFVDAIIRKSVLEHLYNLLIAVSEMYRVLRKGGKLLAYTHFIYPYHAAKPIYLDCFRYGIRELFKYFSHLAVKKHGKYFLALMFFTLLRQTKIYFGTDLFF